MKTLIKWIKAYLRLGIATHQDPQINQQIFVSNLFSMIGYTLTFIMAMGAVYRGNIALALSLITVSGLFFIAHQVHQFGNLQNSHKISTRIVLTTLITLMLYLVYTGGHANTGPLWIYVVPPVVFYFGGIRKGIISLCIFIVSLSILLYLPSEILAQAQYGSEFKSRLMYSFLTVAVLFGFYEYSRQSSYQSMRELSDKFERQAMHDPLTHLANRRAMSEFLAQEYSRAQRSKSDLSVVLCDIDYFKQVNDEHGHDGGDYVLESLCALFVENLRKQDKVARWGGEEFLFLLPDTNATDAYALAEKIRNIVANSSFTFKQKEMSVTCSFGVKQVSRDISVDKAISYADKFLYQAKEAGRNNTQPQPVVDHRD